MGRIPKLTEEEKISIDKLLQIFYESKMSAKEAEILIHLLETMENIELLLSRLEKLPQVDRETIYLQTISVHRNLNISGVFVP